ncbi:hypothetical protein DGMP_11380 [Desulfomarina profundi]|uniref:Nucleotidyltransferase family protein n=1 Tax=Desulfomarina profundi TaxID=2772557 RepID=A0A8D5FGY7_9BACT|nr:nucleotidyltransferase family protein [Desulfomarina profundi]BCL60445.1 hypothetical protein DGMP_11380 [Desulfomarina profundi]
MYSQHPLDRESELLLNCVTFHAGKNDTLNLTPESYSQLNWSKLVELATFHKIVPLLYITLNSFSRDCVPKSFLDSLKEQCHQIGAYNLFLSGTLISILSTFNDEGIRAIPFKGPVLTEMIYGNLSLRSFNDLDILVSRNSLAKAIDLLFQQGFSPDIDLNAKQLIKLADKGHHATMIRGNVIIELHWELTGRYFSRPITLETLEPRITQTTFSGCKVHSLSPEDLLIYLCIHGCRHHWHQLDAICCVAKLIHVRPDLDWKLIMHLCDRQGSSRMVALGLLLSNKIAGVKLPEDALEITNNYSQLQKLYPIILERLFPSRSHENIKFGFFQYVGFHHEVMSNHLDWLRYCLRPLLNPTHSDWLWIRLPASLSLIYYLFRPVRLLIKYLRRKSS